MNLFTQRSRQNHRGRNFLIGLAIASASTLLAFEWQTPFEIPEIDEDLTLIDPIVDPLPPIVVLKKVPKKPKPKVSKAAPKPNPNPPVVVMPISPIDPPVEPDPSIFDNDSAWFTPEVADTVIEPFRIVEQMPEFVGGESALMRYMGKHLKYPHIAKSENIQGKVHVQFVVRETGKVTDVEVVGKTNPYLDAEAKRVVKSFPDWIPGEQRGKKVPVFYVVPIHFQLK
ncbi:MAG: energy transducer TonB [Salibacteraceae bacterium]